MSMIRLGLQLPGFASGEESYYEAGEEWQYSIHDMVQHAIRAERTGFDFISKATEMAMREPFVPYALISQATKRIRLMTSVIDVYTRSPTVAAKAIANLDEVSQGRCVLGIGRGALPLSLQEGIPHKKALQKIREYISIVRLLFSQHTVNFDGETFKIKGAKLGFKPYRKNPPIYLGGAGPKLMQLAGEMADGVFLGTASYVDYVKDALANIKIGAERVERDYKSIEVVGSTLLCVGPREETNRYVKPLVAYFASIGQVEYNLKFMPFQDEIAKISTLYRQDRIREAIEIVTDEMVDAITVTGPRNECRDRLTRFKELGIHTYRILPIGKSITKAYEDTFTVCGAALKESR